MFGKFDVGEREREENCCERSRAGFNGLNKDFETIRVCFTILTIGDLCVWFRFLLQILKVQILNFKFRTEHTAI